MTQRIEYTEEMVGNAHPTKADTLNRFINVITTAGDILYGTASATAARLAAGTANYKLFMNAAGTLPEWAAGSFKGNTTRDLTVATGNVAITGVGFKPSLVILAYGLASADIAGVGFASSTGGAGGIYSNYLQKWLPLISEIGYMHQDAGDFQVVTMASYDADGFTLTFTKTGTPAGSVFINYFCRR